MIKQKKSNKKMLTLSAFMFITFILVLSFFLPLAFNNNNNLEINSGNAFNTNEFFSASFNGSGSASDPYLISDISDLAGLRVGVNSGESFSNKYFILTNNINIPSSVAWDSIGNSDKPFRGIFDGNGYTISNLKFIPTSTHLGLFGGIKNAKIINLQLKNVITIETTNKTTYLGGLVGFAEGDCTLSNIRITNSKLTMTTTKATTQIYVGGLVGYSNATNLMIKKCEILNVEITETVSGSSYTGGIIGLAKKKDPGPGVIIENCKSDGVEFINDIYENNIKIRRSFYNIGGEYRYYGFDNKWNKIFSVDGLFEALNGLSSDIPGEPDVWYKDANEIFIRGVGNVDFKLDTSEAYLSVNFPFPLGYNRKITVTSSDNKFIISGVTIYQTCYSLVYNNSVFPDLKTKAQFAYLVKSGNKRSLDFNISEVFGKLADRQGYFSIALNLTQTSIEVPIKKRYFDINSNSWKSFGEDDFSILVLQNQSFNHKLLLNENESEEDESENKKYNYTYLNAITPNYFEFVKPGAETISISSLSFTFTLEYIEYIKNDYVLRINYTNGFLFKVKASSSILEEYWYSSTERLIHKEVLESVFNPVNLDALSPLIYLQEDYDFVGWSSTKSNELVDFYGRVDGLKFIPWKTDFTLQLRAERANLTEFNKNYSITGIEVSEFENWNFEGFSRSNPLILHPIWGGDTIRLYTYVYSLFNDIYHLKSTLFIDSTAQKVGDFYRLENDGSCDLFLKNSNGTILDLSNGGYLGINWYVSEIKDNLRYDLPDEEGDGFGVLEVNDDNVSATLSGMTRQTCVIVVLEPRKDIGITLMLEEIEVEHEMVFKINDEIIPLNVLREILVYGEEYVIKVENLPEGYHLSEVKITNDVSTTIKINSREGTCTFLVDFVDEIELTCVLAKGLFFELFMYIIASIAIIFLMIIIWLAVGNSIRRKNIEIENKPKL